MDLAATAASIAWSTVVTRPAKSAGLRTVAEEVVQIAVKQLLGVRVPQQLDSGFLAQSLDLDALIATYASQGLGALAVRTTKTVGDRQSMVCPSRTSCSVSRTKPSRLSGQYNGLWRSEESGYRSAYPRRPNSCRKELPGLRRCLHRHSAWWCRRQLSYIARRIIWFRSRPGLFAAGISFLFPGLARA